MAGQDPDGKTVTTGYVAHEAAFPEVYAWGLAMPGQFHAHHLPIGQVVTGRHRAVEQFHRNFAGDQVPEGHLGGGVPGGTQNL